MLSQSFICKSIYFGAIGFSIYAQLVVGQKIATAIVIFTSLLGYFTTIKMIPTIKNYLLKARIFGKDINKVGTPAGEKQVPEALGIVCAFVFMIVSFSSVLVFKLFYSELHLIEKFAALVSIVFSVLLGFVDDILNIPWRYKLIIPLFGILPVLVAYNGSTYVLVPAMLKQYFGNVINLGFLYYIYMAMLGIFATNSINIYAGINGLEVGQSIIIGCAIAVFNSIQLLLETKNNTNIQRHIFSLVILIPFITVSLGLFKFNKFPSQVFVGDTYCYFAGMVLATAGILGHFSKTILLFFIPQIINFVYSLPQLIGIVPCPRHRLPKYNQSTGLLEPIKTNLNLVNLVLWILGPMNEDRLCRVLLTLQVLTSALALGFRYSVALYFF